MMTNDDSNYNNSGTTNMNENYSSGTTDQVRRITMYLNGDSNFLGANVLVNQRYMRTWDTFLNMTTEKIGAHSAVRTIATPVNGTKVKTFDQLQDHQSYVAITSGPFRKLGYTGLLEKHQEYLEKHEKNKLSKNVSGHLMGNDPTAVKFIMNIKPVKHSRIRVASKIKNIPIHAKVIYVYQNGSNFLGAHRIPLSYKTMLDWSLILKQISESVQTVSGAPSALYTVDGTKTVSNFSELENGGEYVLVGAEAGGFQALAYGPQNKIIYVYENGKGDNAPHRVYLTYQILASWITVIKTILDNVKAFQGLPKGLYTADGRRSISNSSQLENCGEYVIVGNEGFQKADYGSYKTKKLPPIKLKPCYHKRPLRPWEEIAGEEMQRMGLSLGGESNGGESNVKPKPKPEPELPEEANIYAEYQSLLDKVKSATSQGQLQMDGPERAESTSRRDDLPSTKEELWSAGTRMSSHAAEFPGRQSREPIIPTQDLETVMSQSELEESDLQELQQDIYLGISPLTTDLEQDLDDVESLMFRNKKLKSRGTQTGFLNYKQRQHLQSSPNEDVKDSSNACDRQRNSSRSGFDSKRYEMVREDVGKNEKNGNDMVTGDTGRNDYNNKESEVDLLEDEAFPEFEPDLEEFSTFEEEDQTDLYRENWSYECPSDGSSGVEMEDWEVYSRVPQRSNSSSTYTKRLSPISERIKSELSSNVGSEISRSVKRSHS